MPTYVKRHWNDLQRRMHAQLYTFLAVDLGTLGDAQQLDAIAQLLEVMNMTPGESLGGTSRLMMKAGTSSD